MADCRVIRDWLLLRMLLRHRIVAKFPGEGVAAKQTLGAQPDSARYAEDFDGLIGVLRAGGLEAARASEENRQIRLVATEREEGKANGKRGWPADRTVDSSRLIS